MLELIFVALNGAVAYSGFCRIVHMSHETTRSLVRHIFVLMSIGAIVSMFAVLFWGYHPRWPALLAPASLLSLLVLGRDRWDDGVPEEYRSDR